MKHTQIILILILVNIVIMGISITVNGLNIRKAKNHIIELKIDQTANQVETLKWLLKKQTPHSQEDYIK